MQRNPTQWQSNTDKLATLTDFSSATVAYSDANTSYSNVNAALDELDQEPVAWTPISKSPELWLPNPAAVTSEYLFDSASHTYDSAVDTYDGIVTGEGFGEQKTPTAWSSL